MSSAYFYDDLPGDETLPHKGAPVSPEALAALGIQAIHVPQQEYEARLKAIAAQRGYPTDAKIQNFSANEKTWRAERIFANEVMWYTLHSGNYADFRDLNDKWIRVPLEGDTLYVTPRGIYNRYVNADKNQSALLLSKGPLDFVERKGTELDNHPARLSFLGSVRK